LQTPRKKWKNRSQTKNGYWNCKKGELDLALEFKSDGEDMRSIPVKRKMISKKWNDRKYERDT